MLFKRLFDSIASFIGGLILLPFSAIIALSVKISSKGPVFYLQKRIGKQGTFSLIIGRWLLSIDHFSCFAVPGFGR